MNEYEFMLFREKEGNNIIFNKEDEEIFRKAMAGETPDSMGILPDENLLFKATKVLKPYEGKSITLYLNDGPIAGLVAVINLCHMLGISLTLAHYNNVTGYFDTQKVM